MNRIVALSLIVLAATLCESALALPLYEPFADATASGGTAYTPGALLPGQTNAQGFAWFTVNTGGTGSAPTNTSGSLTYPGLPAPLGNSLWLTNISGGKGARISLQTNVTTGTFYASFITHLLATNGMTTGGAFWACFNNTAGDSSSALTIGGSKIYARLAVGGYQLGFTKNSTAPAADITWDSTVRTTNDVLFIIVRYSFGPPANANDCKLWINPDSSTFGAASEPTPTVVSSTASGQTNISALASWAFLQRSSLQPPQQIVDELRVGRTWAGVTGGPEIGTQPQSATNNAATSASFSVIAGGTPLLSYQWVKDAATLLADGGNVSGATTATLTLNNVLATDAANYTCIVTNTYGATTSSVATLTVIDPIITAQPSNQTLPPGTTASFTVTAVGTPALAYQWYKDSTPLIDGGIVSGSTTATLTLSGIALSDAGNYSCAVTNGSGAGLISSTAALTVIDPAITSQPQNVTTNFGDTAVFAVAASGTAPLTYQWLKDGASLTDGGNIAGSTSTTLTLTTVSYLDAGAYAVVVTNGNGNSLTSSVATLIVRDPLITGQPVNVTTCEGNPASFSVTAVGSAPLTFQWKRGGINIIDGGTISGATTATLNLSSVSAGDAAGYTVVVGSAAGSNVTSIAATLNVLNLPAITVQPQPRHVSAGDRLAFVVSATGGPPLTYQWQKDGSALANATASAYAIPSAAASDAGVYTVAILNSCSSITSAPAALVVSTQRQSLSPTNLVVVRMGEGTQALSGNGNTVFLDQFTIGGSYVNTVMLPDSGPTPFIQGGTSTVEGYLSRSADGRLLCLAGYDTNLTAGTSVGGASSALLPRVVGTINGLGVFSRPVKTTTKFSATTFRSAVTDGTNNFWGAGGNSGTVYFGPGSPAADVQTTKPNTRVLEIQNGELWTSSASVVGDGVQGIYKFTGLPVTSIGLPAVSISTNTGAGDGLNDFAVSLSGTTLYFSDDRNSATNAIVGGIQRWDFNGTIWTNTYTLHNGLGAVGTRHLTVDWSGANPIIYAVTTPGSQNQLVTVIDTGAGSPFTTLATAGPNQLLRGVKFGPVSDAPAIALQPTNQTNNAGTTATFTVSVTGTAPLSLQWYRNGLALSNAGNVSGVTTTSLTLSNVSQADATNGSYTVVITNDLGTVTSAAVTLTVIDEPVITSQPASITRIAGAAATFMVGYTGTAPTFQWNKNGSPLIDAGNISGATTDTLTISNVQDADAANYTVSLSNAAGTTNSDPATLTVLNPPVITSTPSSRTNQVGSVTAFTVTATGSAPLSYQWQKNSAPLADGGNVTGATTDTLTLTSLSRADAGAYTVVVTNAAGSVTSAPPAVLTIVEPPAITSQPSSRTNIAGTTATFTVTATGTGPLSYQWQKDGSPLADGGNVSGVTTSALSLSNVSNSDAAAYTVVVTNVAGSLTSAPPATLTVIGPPVILTTLLDGSNLIFSGNGGPEGTTYHVIATTNITNALSSWTPIQTNTFGAGGTFSVTNPVTGQDLQFFSLRVP